MLVFSNLQKNIEAQELCFQVEEKQNAYIPIFPLDVNCILNSYETITHCRIAALSSKEEV